MFKAVYGSYSSDPEDCGLQCLTTSGCESFTINEQSAEQCQLHNKQALTELVTYNSSNLWVKHRELLSISLKNFQIAMLQRGLSR